MANQTPQYKLGQELPSISFVGRIGGMALVSYEVPTPTIKHLLIGTILLLSFNVASASGLDIESLAARINSPTFPEIQSEVIEGHITFYGMRVMS